MQGAGQNHGWSRTLDFFADRYPEQITEVRHAGRLGATLVDLELGRGDWSGAAVPELGLTILTSSAITATLDLGAGRFRARCERHGFVLAAPDTPTTFLVDSPHTVRFLGLPYAQLLKFAGEDSGLPVDGDFGRLHGQSTQSREVVSTIERLWRSSTASTNASRLYSDGLLLEVAAGLMALGLDETLDTRGRLPPRKERLLVDYVRTHLSEDLSLEELARVGGLSAFHFSRQFKRTFGLTPYAYVRQRRIERAKELLAGTNEPIAEIGAGVGYESPQAFARMFRAEVGVSLSQFREAGRPR